MTKLDTVTIGELAYEFISGRLSKNTRSAYAQDLRALVEFTGGDLSDRRLLQYRNFLIDTYAPRTGSRMLTTASQFIQFLMYKRILDRNYLEQIDRPVVDKHSSPHIALADDEVRRLIDVPDRSTVQGASMRLSLILSFCLGMRVSEIAALKHQDMNEDHLIVVKAKGGQSRTIPYSDFVLEEVRSYMDMLAIHGHPKSPANPLILSQKTVGQSRPEHVNRTTIWRWFLSCAEFAQIAHITTHSGRATAITKALDEGVSIRDVCVFAGHRDINTTMSYDKHRGEATLNTMKKIRY